MIVNAFTPVRIFCFNIKSYSLLGVRLQLAGVLDHVLKIILPETLSSTSLNSYLYSHSSVCLWDFAYWIKNNVLKKKKKKKLPKLSVQVGMSINKFISVLVTLFIYQGNNELIHI